MIVDDIKDRVLEALQAAKAAIEETDAYMQLKERYDSLNPSMQKVLLGAIGFLFAYLVIQIPMGYYTSGSDNLALFDENRDLILDLYRAKRRSALAPTAPSPLSAGELESRSRNALVAARIPPDQIKSISPFDNRGPQSSSFIPGEVEQKGVEVHLANLNVNQIIEVGHSLLTVSDSARMIGIEVKAGTHAGSYFDTTYKIVSFAIPGKKP